MNGDRRTTVQSKKQAAKRMDEAVAQIAKETLYIETMETRSSDELDFHDLAIWRIRAALEAAYKAGAEATWATVNANVARNTRRG
jgi:hypothetical protein